jgi:hypothetical protein
VCQACETFAQLRDAMRTYDRSAVHLYSGGQDAAAERDDLLSAAIRSELHVYDRTGKPDQDILWMEA